MTGLKMTTMTTKEMRAARDRGESKTDLELLRHNQLAGLEPEDDKDAPDASVVMLEAIAQRRSGHPREQRK